MLFLESRRKATLWSRELNNSEESLQPHPHLKNGTAYRQVRPTKLDKIKNFHLEVQAERYSSASMNAGGLPRAPEAGPLIQ